VLARLRAVGPSSSGLHLQVAELRLSARVPLPRSRRISGWHKTSNWT